MTAVFRVRLRRRLAEAAAGSGGSRLAVVAVSGCNGNQLSWGRLAWGRLSRGRLRRRRWRRWPSGTPGCLTSVAELTCLIGLCQPMSASSPRLPNSTGWQGCRVGVLAHPVIDGCLRPVRLAGCPGSLAGLSPATCGGNTQLFDGIGRGWPAGSLRRHGVGLLWPA